MRALVLAHGHPNAGVGGGELAAYNLFRALRERADTGNAHFLARSADPGLSPGAIVAMGNGEFLWRRGTADWFRHRGDDASPAALRSFLRETAPDAVFVHHFAHLGIEVLGEIRRALPRAAIVLTLHDFAAICHNGGLMAKTGFSRAPCERSSPEDCHACFPDRLPSDFAERHAGMLRHLQAVDSVVSPSLFLKGRYAEWGLNPARIVVIENGLEPMAPEPRQASPNGRIHLGFFGQVREAKGLDILLAALHLLPPAEHRCFELSVNGSRLEAQAAWYRELIARLRAPLEAEGVLRWPGAYRRDELSTRMAGLDWVVVPSTWWENAPIVIQEAFAHGIPVIGTDHGGIAEKVRNGIDGLLFAPRDPHSLATLLRTILAEPARRKMLARNIRAPFTMEAMAAAYVEVAESIRRRKLS